MRHLLYKLFCLFLITLAGGGCGQGSGGGGHDPNLPIPPVISDSVSFKVDHTADAVMTTPDGMATLSIPANALIADVQFEIKPYLLILPEGPIFRLGRFYSFTPVNIRLNPAKTLTVTLRYDPSPLPIKDLRLALPVIEQDLRLALFQDSSNISNRCWIQVFLDAPAVNPSAGLHEVFSHSVTQLGVFGITTINSETCPHNFINP